MSDSQNLKPTIIGIYGIPGSGKSTALKKLQQFLKATHFLLFEGAEVIDSLAPGGLDAFKIADEESKYLTRCKAIKFIEDECVKHHKAAIVTGHLMFWDQRTKTLTSVHTDKDVQIYTHIIYLKTDAGIVFQRCINDKSRKDREVLYEEKLQEWQTEEIILLRSLCKENSILLSVITSADPIAQLVPLIFDFVEHNEEVNLARARNAMNEIVTDSTETMLVFDADKTLAPVDTSEMFWELTPARRSPVAEVLSGPNNPYTYFKFRQAMLRYEETAGEEEYETFCRMTAERVKIHPEFIELITRASSEKHTSCVVVTGGMRRVWQLVLENHGLSVKVIGGCRLEDQYVVSEDVKTGIVDYLRSKNLFVCAYGDSPLDLGALSAANLAVVVVGPPSIRSSTMTGKLQDAINNGLKARQVLLPDSNQILNVTNLPVMKLSDEEFLRQIFCRRVRVVTADENAAKLLMTPTRDKNISGPALFEAHRRIGWYLATHHLSKLIGVESYDIPHVQGRATDGFRFAQENKTTIIALMRGGEPMALGVWGAMPLAMFVHAFGLSFVEDHHIKDKSTVIIVDSVVNSGKSVVEFVHGIRGMNSAAMIIVVAGVIQQDAVFDRSSSRAFLSLELGSMDNLYFVALRTSENKFKGSGTTDTGNRLFNTPQIL